jgi:7-keto-8-aminopelargonate synthetase-like enzyme
LLLLTDGLFSHSGEVAPLREHLRLLPPQTVFLVDDSHGAGVLGQTGCGTAEHLRVSTRRLILTITLSKAFGVYGGAILARREVQRKILARSRLFTGNTPLPLPLAAAALTSLELVRSNPAFRRRLASNAGFVKAALREAGFPVNDGPGPIISLLPHDAHQTVRLRRALLAAGIYPPFINYPSGLTEGYFRFVISSEHTSEQLQTLAKALKSCLTAP